MTHGDFSAEGGCACRTVRYLMSAPPIIVHCCHCRWCQRETGSAFVLNALVESDRVRLLAGEPALVLTPSESGKGQTIARCPACGVALWSHYGAAGEKINFMRVGAFDEPDRFPPDIHIYTDSKQPWVALADGKPTRGQFYNPAELWPAASLERFRAVLDHDA
ncbi:MAG: GFA family protein [Amphiplicatus sp.]